MELSIQIGLGFPDSSVGKESACNAGDPGLIPGSGIGYSIQYSWASLVAQLVKNPSTMWETWVLSLVWEDPLEKGKVYPLQYSGLENSMDCIVHGMAKNQTRLSNFHFLFHFHERFCGASGRNQFGQFTVSHVNTLKLNHLHSKSL